MKKHLAILLTACATGMLTAGVSLARHHDAKPAFKYVGGTMALPPRCEGNLEMNSDNMVFECGESSVRISYSSIRFMQYRTNISRKVRRMKPHWKVDPHTALQIFGTKNNRYFTIVYREKDERPLAALVLAVSPDAMRPYLAEIDLRAGQRVEVQELDD